MDYCAKISESSGEAEEYQARTVMDETNAFSALTLLTVKRVQRVFTARDPDSLIREYVRIEVVQYAARTYKP